MLFGIYVHHLHVMCHVLVIIWFTCDLDLFPPKVELCSYYFEIQLLKGNIIVQ
jgi:hypothetical protein